MFYKTKKTKKTKHQKNKIKKIDFQKRKYRVIKPNNEFSLSNRSNIYTIP